MMWIAVIMSDEVTKGARTTEQVRIIIADDHALVRESLRDMLEDELGLEVVGEAANGWEALQLCRRLRPDLVLIDVRMPKMDGLQATHAIKQELPATAVLVVTMQEDPDYLYEALKVGAAGYVLKESTQDEVITAVRQVLDGEAPLNLALATQLLRRLVTENQEHRAEGAESPPAPEKRSEEPPAQVLTPREVEVLRLLAQGKTNPEIAQELVVSRGTVKAHVQNIIRNLGVSDRTQAVVRAIELGILGF